jgi:carbon monoxide dehydrogenase subunit G
MTEARLSGRTAIAAAPAVVAAALQDPALLRRMIPGCSDISPAGPDTWSARIEKAAGPVTLRLVARIALRTLPDGTGYVLTAQGKSLIAGSVSLRLALALCGTDGTTLLEHDGSLRAEGLAGRLLQGNQARVAARADQMFSHLREQIEAAARA